MSNVLVLVLVRHSNCCIARIRQTQQPAGVTHTTYITGTCFLHVLLRVSDRTYDGYNLHARLVDTLPAQHDMMHMYCMSIGPLTPMRSNVSSAHTVVAICCPPYAADFDRLRCYDIGCWIRFPCCVVAMAAPVHDGITQMHGDPNADRRVVLGTSLPASRIEAWLWKGLVSYLAVNEGLGR
jgi:hypothetical protein